MTETTMEAASMQPPKAANASMPVESTTKNSGKVVATAESKKTENPSQESELNGASAVDVTMSEADLIALSADLGKKRSAPDSAGTGNADGGAAAAEEGVPRKKRAVESSGDVEMTATTEPDAEDTVADSQSSTEGVDLTEFHANLKEGDEVDVFCVRTKVWLPAKIEKEEADVFTVHFLNWNKKSNEEINPSSLKRIAPRGSEAADAWHKHEEKQEKLRRSREEKARKKVELLTSATTADSTEITVTEAPAFIEAGLTRSGRKITKRLVNEASVIRKKPSSKPVKKKSAAEYALEIQEENTCAICGEYEDDAMTDMIFCDGGCLNSYHFSCLGLDEMPQEDDKWLCEQCRTNEQQCFCCGRNDTIGERGGVFRCSVPSCGKFYHQNCVNANKLSRRMGRASKPTASTAESSAEGNTTTDADESSASEAEMGAFRCPRHICSVCEDTKRGSDLMYCLKCPESYHPHCVPPSARYNNVGLLCFRHPEDKLPRIPTQFLHDRNFDSVVVDYNLRLPTLFLPRQEPDASNANDCHHFRLSVDFLDDVKQQPPTYRKLARNLYTFKQPKESLEDVPLCVCKESCGDDCINRLSFTECFGPAPTPGMPFNRADKNKESNCPLGEQCGNRALHQRMYPKFERFHSPDKGWGLKILEPVKAGQLVIEYVGEVINEEEKNRRLSEHARLNPEDKNMYIMELSNGVYIDARHKGSVSRFINHSCDPNCHLLKWNVRGVNRIAITALTDIEAGVELSYDYQFHTSQAMQFRCFCKSKNCRGTMAPEKLNLSADEEDGGKKLTKKEQQKKLKRAMQQEKLNAEKEEKATARRLSCTAPISRSIARTGPATRELLWAKQTHPFLMRNAIRGFDFLARREMLDKRIATKAKQSGVVKTEVLGLESPDDVTAEALVKDTSSGVRLKVVKAVVVVQADSNAVKTE
ncbi:hypothetical protein Poli38472_002271 [Pythium oligandrum]|uniref:Histone-lysine N-methyltransferase n=1 Tax=Pythium oligandrum TaxID=41045 RepID=A0A8K1FGZ4_PYTOL|nr:hypothetical protein Poli38472_002271 [Pythium oligandrum]|eukprot:TMW63330.1 hypothetical protein Poli38472_002271 [Pythium oligandrum]